jgi:hypothetical protein
LLGLIDGVQNLPKKFTLIFINMEVGKKSNNEMKRWETRIKKIPPFAEGFYW